MKEGKIIMNKKKSSKLALFSVISMVVGVLCLLVKGLNPGTVDSNGTLVEPLFFLLPIGFLLLFIGVLFSLYSLIKYTARKK